MAACLFLAAGQADAETVTFNGSLGASKALLMIDGKPRTLGVGDQVGGVKLLAVSGDQVEIQLDGKRVTLRIGASQVSFGAKSGPGTGSEVVMTAGLGGHFMPSGSINGHAASFMIDTGATSVAIGQADAARWGIDTKNARRAMAGTANGAVPVSIVSLTSIRLGEVEIFNVEAVVMPVNMPYVLLGNSFLTRFQMRRENDTMTLVKRP